MYFLKNVFRDVIGNGKGHNAVDGHTLFNIAVHAVLLEFGFVWVDPLSQREIDTQPKKTRKIDRFHLPEGRTRRSGHVRYTASDLMSVGGEVLETIEFNKVVEFWRIVKDELALPFLTDLCEKTGLIPPPCFTRLPADLKLKILEFLPSWRMKFPICRDISKTEDEGTRIDHSVTEDFCAKWKLLHSKEAYMAGLLLASLSIAFVTLVSASLKEFCNAGLPSSLVVNKPQ
ncbi:hypothetical protein IFM89_024189 [Coptis chinensis]|uniref:Uncharacterized protein n=1 Tax=Coptis chinensis TaxID=261450 RepID=A0A835LSV5_9MAGN|nr:hypothetical protein IFM89_024189 [Coptis chinensis]